MLNCLFAGHWRAKNANVCALNSGGRSCRALAVPPEPSLDYSDHRASPPQLRRQSVSMVSSGDLALCLPPFLQLTDERKRQTYTL